MKKSYIILAAVLLTATTWAQSPEKMNYQTSVRDASGNILANQLVSFRMSVLESTSNGTTVYVETHLVTTGNQGLVDFNIGSGAVQSGLFDTIDWGTNSYYLQVELDITGGSSYSVIGTTQFVSVPYALHAKTAERVTSSCGLAIGDTHQGGIIFYLDASGCHGLIAAPSDQSTGIQWYNGSFVDTYAYGNGIGAGEGNSQGIRRWQSACSSCYASELCQDLSLGGYNDWYLPSKYELNLMWLNLADSDGNGVNSGSTDPNNIGNFATGFYWSSTENSNFGNAWGQSFGNGVQEYGAKSVSCIVRAVRAF